MRWPFDDWLRLAVIKFGLSSSEFWVMSLKDWRALTQTETLSPLPRDVFDELRTAYPDGGCDET